MTKKEGLDIFSGAGGLSLGAELAGVSVKYAVECNPSAAKTFRRNHREVEVIEEDIVKVDTSRFKGQTFFIVMGGPPCQGFSLSNTRSRTIDNPKNFLFTEFVRFVKELKPAWFLFENVGGFPVFEKGLIKEEVERLFKKLGYHNIKSDVLWAHDYGVPQSRNRFFMVGNRMGIKFEFPKPHGKKVTVMEAIGDLPHLVNGEMLEVAPYDIPLDLASDYARLMRSHSHEAGQNYVSRNSDLVIQRYAYIPQGGNWRDIPVELMHNYADKGRCHSGIYRRLRADRPSVVISNYRKSMLIHPTQDRGLSVREAARIQSFPDDFIFEGPISHIQQQIGNAVPPLLAKAVIQQILSYYE